MDTVPITTRQLEALIRLCQARAKACLRDFVLKEDALDVVELMSSSVEQVHSDEKGNLDVSRGGAGGKSNRKMKKAFVDELQRIVGIDAECTLDDLVCSRFVRHCWLAIRDVLTSRLLQRRIADKVNCGLAEFSGLIEDLRNGGVLLKKANGRYHVLS
jgi:DNA replicative helicase MCM subunit Mcm2 (Cdc46/Mcm family)